jgi:hypothetical protein
MPDVKISALPASTTPLAGTEVLPIVQSATTRQVSVANLTAGRSVGGTNFIPSGSSAPTNGMFLPAANNLGFSTNSIEQMRIDSSGNVGIGTISPDHKLDISGSLCVDGFASAANNYITLRNTFSPSSAGGSGFKAVNLGSGNDDGLGAYGHQGIIFYSAQTERARIPSAGGFQATTTISVGNATPSASGAGITFPATQSASSDANTLDDYEEGTWTPSFTLSSGSATATVASGSYVKIGRQVSLTICLEFSVPIAASIEDVTGLPFTAANSVNQAVGALRENSVTGFMWQLRPSLNATTALIRRYDNLAVLADAMRFNGTVTYFV